MIISYKWLSEYLPVQVSPERLAHILTSIGLEVEKMETYQEFKGGLNGLVIGEIVTCEQHPNADKLKCTTVNIGSGEPLKIVCGAPNAAVGQKVVVAPAGTTIYPANDEPQTMKPVKIRGEESMGMICAEDEIGLGESHAGIMVLPEDAKPGTPAAEYFGVYNDIIFEIGLTPNRMDAMSHWGVARDVCAYLTHHDKQNLKPKLPVSNHLAIKKETKPLTVIVENNKACPRYSGICISNVNIGESPKWLQHKLKAIGLRPINNLVDITNFIQHETGQPLHAFDADKIKGNTVIVKNLAEGATFVTLDEKERKLSAEDLMICDAEGGMCIGGVFGGLHSGVTNATKNIFLESAYFDPITIRKTSFRYGLRTDAATRFEKGTDIAATVNVLKRAAALILEICGGEISSDIYDIFPHPANQTQVVLTFHYLKKLSGKNYHPEDVKIILQSLGFTIEKETIDALHILVPHHKPDVNLPADIVEEIIRIDGLDNVDIPTSITITPSVDENIEAEILKEKVSNYLVGLGFNEILTNSITNKSYFTEEELTSVVKMKNSLSAELNIMRPNMLETGLEVIAHNLNRKNDDLKLFEFGRTYSIHAKGNFEEPEHLCLYFTGKKENASWKNKAVANDFYTVKGVCEKIFELLGINEISYENFVDNQFEQSLTIKSEQQMIARFGSINKKSLHRFDIKQQIFYADLDWNTILKIALKHKPIFAPIPKFPAVQRDLAMIVAKDVTYQFVKDAVDKLRFKKLRSMQLFDVFESEKLGKNKKSLAVNFTFLDEEKTLTDNEIDGWMKKIIQGLEKDLQAAIRS
jgi:phenylalanyl-tRNA synthetase beta chain